MDISNADIQDRVLSQYLSDAMKQLFLRLFWENLILRYVCSVLLGSAPMQADLHYSALYTCNGNEKKLKNQDT